MFVNTSTLYMYMLWIFYIQVSKRSQNKENLAPKAPKKRRTNTNWYCTIHFVCTAPLTLLSLFVGLLQGPASCQVCAHCIWVSSFQLAIHYPFHNLLWPGNTARWGVGTYVHTQIMPQMRRQDVFAVIFFSSVRKKRKNGRTCLLSPLVEHWWFALCLHC